MEQACIAGEVDASLYPAAVLIDDLRSDDLLKRLNSVKSLAVIATALGPQRACEELLPFLQEECTDDDDDVLFALAEQLERGVSWVGGTANASALLLPLEQLCCAEECSVRDRATQAIREITRQMSHQDASAHVGALIGRLTSHEWFTARMAACSIFTAAQVSIQEAKQKDELTRSYLRLCSDNTPMVRRQAASALGGIAEVLSDNPMMSDIFEAFKKLAKDEQDSVRILAIKNCIILGKLKSAPVWQQEVMAVVKECCDDKSWRVRYMVADQVKELCEVFEVPSKTSIVPLFMKLLADQEMEVRTIASARILPMAKLHPTKEFLESLLPVMKDLTLPKELSPQVRGSLAGSILSLTSIFGAKLTGEHLLDLCTALIKDESSDVRLKLVYTLGDPSLLGSEPVMHSLLPAIRELAKDRQWRVRVAVLDALPHLATSLGEARFNEELHSIFLTWLVDPVYAVRRQAASIYKGLCEVFGDSWISTKVIPELQNMLGHKKYLIRVSAIPCVGMLAEKASNQFVETDLAPMLVKLSKDPVPNVRINVGKTIQSMQKNCPASHRKCIDEQLLPCIQKLSTDEDSDVKSVATSCLTQMTAST